MHVAHNSRLRCITSTLLNNTELSPQHDWWNCWHCSFFSSPASFQNGAEDRHDLVKGNREFSPFILFVPAMCDMIATSIMYVGLNLTYASSFQMLRGKYDSESQRFAFWGWHSIRLRYCMVVFFFQYIIRLGLQYRNWNDYLELIGRCFVNVVSMIA